MDENKNMDIESARNMHQTFLEALRSREQEILQFIAILAPALGGFIWLVKIYFENDKMIHTLIAGTIGVLLLLCLGAMYALALGYNFRYITFQLAKMESINRLNIIKFILAGWDRTIDHWNEKYKNKCCYPPEIILIFWFAFVIAQIFVTIAAVSVLCVTNKISFIYLCFIIVSGLICIAVSTYFGPTYYGKKFSDLCKREKEKETEKW